MKKLFSILLALLLCAIPALADDAEPAVPATIEDVVLEEGVLYYADIEIQDYGTITVLLDPTAAPLSVRNFLFLAQTGFYEGTTFHRIIEGFMMQGGAAVPGYTGTYYRIYGEFAANGWDNPLKHTRGVISMARTNDPNSATSQFFIMHQDSPHLDGMYAAFGCVVDEEGLAIVDAICESARPTDNNGSIAASEQPVIVSVTVRTVPAEEAEAAE